MKNKWYISALIVVLAIVGFSLEKSAVPNQEIVIQFSDTEVTLDQAQDAITLIKGQLTSLDVDQIRIDPFQNGTLKIKYYSDIEVSQIKEIVSQALALSQMSQIAHQEDSESPFEKESKQYLLDIHKIQDTNDLLGTQGTIVESKTGTTRSLPLNAYASLCKQDAETQNQAKSTTYIAHRNPAIALENASYKIPEVRAGPCA